MGEASFALNPPNASLAASDARRAARLRLFAARVTGAAGL